MKSYFEVTGYRRNFKDLIKEMFICTFTKHHFIKDMCDEDKKIHILCSRCNTELRYE